MKGIANHCKTNVNTMYRTQQQRLKAYQTLYSIVMTQLEELFREEFIKVGTSPGTLLPEDFQEIKKKYFNQ